MADYQFLWMKKSPKSSEVVSYWLKDQDDTYYRVRHPSRPFLLVSIRKDDKNVIGTGSTPLPDPNATVPLPTTVLIPPESPATGFVTSATRSNDGIRVPQDPNTVRKIT